MNKREGLIKQFLESKDFKEHLRIAEEHILESFLYATNTFYDINFPPPQEEIWLPIKGYFGIYEISSCGRIKSLERLFIKKNSRSTGLKAVYIPEKIRSQRFTKAGYSKMSLWNNSKAKHVLVHRLVAQYFIPNPNKYKQVAHIDNNPSNAKWDNLQWGTQKMNIQYAVKCGRWHTGSKNFQTKLKETDIPEIRKLISEGVSSRKIGEQFGVRHHAILSIKNVKTWKHIKITTQ